MASTFIKLPAIIGVQQGLQQTLVDSANISWDLTFGNGVITLTDDRVLDNPSNLSAGQSYILIVKQDATGSRSLTYGAAYKWFGGIVPVLSTAANSIDIITFYCDGTDMFGSIQRGFA